MHRTLLALNSSESYLSSEREAKFCHGFSRRSRAVTAKKCTKKRAARAELLFCFSLAYYIVIVGFRDVSNEIQ